MTLSDSDLPAALRKATAELVAEKGAGGFSLREVARRTGVSHAAPGHHFGSSRGLMTAVAVEGFEKLAEALEDATEPTLDPIERLTRLGQAYVRCATTYPGHFAVMSRDDLTDPDDPEFLTASLRAFACLVATIEDIAEAVNPNLDVEQASILCWALMDGLLSINPHLDKLRELDMITTSPVDEVIAQFAPLIINGFRSN